MKQMTQGLPIPKSAKETLYNSLMQSWQKIKSYDHEEKNNHILIAESYGLDELVKYFNDTIDEDSILDNPEPKWETHDLKFEENESEPVCDEDNKKTICNNPLSHECCNKHHKRI